MRCDECGGRLEVYQGEPYCPDCTTWSLAAAPDAAADDADQGDAGDLVLAADPDGWGG